MRDAVTAERLRQVISYDGVEGTFTWKVSLSNRAPVGSSAGSIDKTRGYLTISIDGLLYQAHRLAWLYVYGEWPSGEIDHRDTDKLNNCIANLRDVSFAVNQQNVRRPRSHNTSGYQGVIWDKRRGKWRAQITVGKKCLNLGAFADPAIAHSAYLAAKRIHHEGNTL